MMPDEWPHIRSIAKYVLPVLVGPRIARTGASERGAMPSNVAPPRRSARFHSTSGFRAVLTLFRQTGPCVDGPTQCGAGFRPADQRGGRARAIALPAVGMENGGRAGSVVQRRRHGGFAEAGGAAPRRADAMAGAWHRPAVERRCDRASHGRNRERRAHRLRAQTAAAVEAAPAMVKPAPTASGPLRIRGRVGDGLYWSLRAAGASPGVAAQYLAALATEINVGEVAPGDSFDLVLGGRNLLYAGLNRAAAQPMQLVRWTAGGQRSGSTPPAPTIRRRSSRPG